MWKWRSTTKKSDEAPEAYPGAPLDSERAKQPPLPEPPLYKPYAKLPADGAPYEPYAKKPGAVEPRYEPYKDI